MTDLVQSIAHVLAGDFGHSEALAFFAEETFNEHPDELMQVTGAIIAGIGQNFNGRGKLIDLIDPIITENFDDWNPYNGLYAIASCKEVARNFASNQSQLEAYTFASASLQRLTPMRRRAFLTVAERLETQS